MRDRQDAICLRTTDYSETSQVVHFLTRGAGVVRLIAKGAKRPKSKTGGAIDLLADGDLVYSTGSGEGLGTLIEFTEVRSHGRLRRDTARLNTAVYMLELAGEMIAEADPHPEAFDLLRRTLWRLGEADAPVQAVLAYYQWRLLRHAGVLGELKQCASCGASPGRRNVHFSSAGGGLLCAACEASAAEKYRLDGTTLAGLAALSATDNGTRVALPEPQARAVNRMLAYHVRELLGKPLRMTRYAIG